MDDILASIRRILNEEEKSGMVAPQDDVFVLDESMMVGNNAPERDPPPGQPVAAPLPTDVQPGIDSTTTAPAVTMPEPDRAMKEESSVEPSAHLVAPETAAAAATSLGALRRTLAADRGTQVRSGGPTIEDIVREEIRPMLKAWLDAHLPMTVERLVKAEIEKVVGRSAP